jgi:hypothetical protein
VTDRRVARGEIAISENCARLALAELTPAR